MILSKKFDEIRSYLDKAEEELREELGLPINRNASIGISIDDSISLTKMPQFKLFPTGMYQLAYDKSETHKFIEVIGQDQQTGIISVSIGDKLDTIGPLLFDELFKEI